LVDTIGYLCLKSQFKDALFQADFASFMNQLTALVVKEEEQKREIVQTGRRVGVFQSFIFLILNLVRDSRFD